MPSEKNWLEVKVESREWRDVRSRTGRAALCKLLEYRDYGALRERGVHRKGEGRLPAEKVEESAVTGVDGQDGGGGARVERVVCQGRPVY